MKVFVTGGSGFIGSHFVDRLIKERHIMTPHPNEADVVYHLAGLIRKGLPAKEYWDVHVGMTQDLLEEMDDNQKFVYMSTAYIDYPKGPYEITKIEGEKVVRGSRVAYSIIRPGPVYGPRSLSLLRLCRWLKRLGGLFPIVGSGKDLVCPIYIDDVIDFKPEFLILIDTCNVNKPPGTISILERESISEYVPISTHTIPVHIVVDLVIEKLPDLNVFMIGFVPESLEGFKDLKLYKENELSLEERSDNIDLPFFEINLTRTLKIEADKLIAIIKKLIKEI